MPDTSRTSASRLFSLLSEWDARRASGEVVAPADLCPADLTLQRQLAEHIAAVLAVEKQRGRLGAEATDGGGGEETAAVHGFPSPPGLQLHEEIGRGGMGVVFRAVDREFGRPLAVKVMRPGLPEGRFLAEADTMARLQHPGVPPVFARGRLPGGQPYFAMKLVAGRSLHEALAARPSPQQGVPQLLAVFEQVCQAVGYAHSQGVIHRDLKPHNVMIGAFGEVQLMDWGLAKDTGLGGDDTSPADTAPLEAGETHPGSVLGTPGYMAPEQARGEVADARSDAFALGGILGAILTGHPPYVAGTAAETVRRAAAADLSDAFTRLDACGADPELTAVAKRCLSAEPAGRYADGRAVAEAVTAYRAGVEERVRRAQADRAAAEAEAREQRKRRRVQLALALALTTVVGLVSVGGWWGQKVSAGKVAANIEQRANADLARERARNLVTLATELRKEYRYPAAANALREAGELAETFAPDIAEGITQAKGDLDFVVELDSIRMKRSTLVIDEKGNGRFEVDQVPGEYRQAFDRRGLDVASEPDQVADRVNASAIRSDIVTALDDWSIFESNEVLRDKVLSASTRADPHSQANAFRNAKRWGDTDSIKALVAKLDASQLSPTAVVTIAEVMKVAKIDSTPLLRKAAVRHPQDYLVAIALSQSLGELEPEQIGALRAARAARPDSTAALITLANSLLQQKNFRASVDACHESIRLRPNYRELYNSLGLALRLTGDSKGAILSFQQAVQIDPAYAVAHHNLGNAFRLVGNTAEAIRSGREAVRLGAKYAPYYIGLGSALRANGELTESIACYREAIHLDPKSADAYTSLGNALRAAGKMSDALVACREAVRLDANSAIAHNSLGVVLRALGQLDESLKSYDTALSIDPNYAESYNNIGSIQASRSDYTAATISFRKSIRITPNIAQFHANLGLALRLQDDFDAAIESLTTALRLDPRHMLANANIAICYDQKRMYKMSIEYARKCIALNPKIADAYAILGRGLEHIGDLGGSHDAFTRAAQLDPKMYGSQPRELAPPPRPVAE